MTVLDLKACQTPLALYFSINLWGFFCFVFFNLLHFSLGNSCCRNGVAMDYTKNVHNWELKWKALHLCLAASFVVMPCCVLQRWSAKVLKYTRIIELQI